MLLAYFYTKPCIQHSLIPRPNFSHLVCYTLNIGSSESLYFLQVCVSECPTANEFGVRNNPVCVEDVDTSRFMNLDDITAVSDIRVSSLSLSLSHTNPLPLIILHLIIILLFCRHCLCSSDKSGVPPTTSLVLQVN